MLNHLFAFMLLRYFIGRFCMVWKSKVLLRERGADCYFLLGGSERVDRRRNNDGARRIVSRAA